MTNTSPLLSYRQLLSYTLKLFQFRLRTALVLAGIFQLGVALIALVFQNQATVLSGLLTMGWSLVGIYLFATFVLALKTSTDKEDAPMSVILQRAAGRFFPALGGSLLMGLVMMLVLVLVLGFTGVGYALGGRGGLLMALAFFGLIAAVCSFVFLVYMNFFTFFIILDKTPVVQSFRNSYQLVKKHFWYVLGYLVVLIVLSLGFNLLIGLCQVLFLFLEQLTSLASALNWLVGLAAAIITTAFMQTAATVFYLNLTDRITSHPQTAAQYIQEQETL